MVETAIPTKVVYFTVRVPFNHAYDGRHRAAEIANRYLYDGWTVVDARDDYDNELFLVTVRLESFEPEGGEFLDRRVQYQRDRFASGMYGTTEPVILGRI
jgi:hypothetical protein